MRKLLVAAILAAAVAIAGCGSDDDKPVKLSADSSCADWGKATVAERRRFAETVDKGPADEFTYLNSSCAGPITDPEAYGKADRVKLGELVSNLSGNKLR